MKKQLRVLSVEDSEADAELKVREHKIGGYDVITEHVVEHSGKHQEDLMKDSKETFNNLFEHAPDATYLTDHNGTFVDVNNALEQLTGYGRKELIGKSMLSLGLCTSQQGPNVAPRSAPIVNNCTTQPEEFTLIRKDGSEITAEMQTFPVKIAGQEFMLGIARDITQRKEIAAGLEKTRKELEVIKKSADETSEFAESVINTVREPLISLDQDLRVVTVSRSFYEFFKVKPEETVGQLIYDLGNKQWDIPKLRELLETILPQRTSFNNYEVEHDFATIGRRTMLLNGRQIERAFGKERIILLAIEDITERKEIEAGLEKTRKELVVIKQSADEASEFAESVINTVREPLLSLDQDLRVVTVSRSYYDFFKVKPEETVGQLIYDLGNKQWDIPRLRELLETVLPEKATFDGYEVEHDFATIGKRIMLLNARQIQRGFGKERIILLAIEDVTARMQMERAYSQLAAIVETADDAIIGKDLEGVIVSWNNGAEFIYGYNATEVIGKSVSVIMPPDRPDEYKDLLMKKVSGELVKNYETQRRKKDGKIIDVSLTVSPFKDVSGKIIGDSTIARDITEKKNLELGVVRARDAAQAANKELEAFSYSVSHDLRAPLRHVSGYVELLAKNFQSELSEKGVHYLDCIADSAHQMGKLIDDLLHFSRTGRAEMRSSQLEMNDIVQEAVASVSEDNPDRAIEWVVGKLPSFCGDDAMLRLVWANLLSNAVKFTRIREKALIEIGATADAKEITFFVKDNGAGFDMQYAPKLFGVFQRLHSTEEFEGTGVGLANVRRIITRHGGRTWAEAEPEKGATFYFSIPKN